MIAADTLSRELRWSCDERNRVKCRNSHGCHCREITDRLHRLAAKPADDGVRELMAATEPFALLAPLVEFTDHRDGERVHEQRDPTTGKYMTLYRKDFRRLKRAYDALSTKAPKP